MEPDLATATTKQIQRDMAAAQAVVTAWEPTDQPSRPLCADDINLALDHADGLAQILQEAERETRVRLYRTSISC